MGNLICKQFVFEDVRVPTFSKSKLSAYQKCRNVYSMLWFEDFLT